MCGGGVWGGEWTPTWEHINSSIAIGREGWRGVALKVRCEVCIRSPLVVQAAVTKVHMDMYIYMYI